MNERVKRFAVTFLGFALGAVVGISVYHFGVDLPTANKLNELYNNQEKRLQLISATNIELTNQNSLISAAANRIASTNRQLTNQLGTAQATIGELQKTVAGLRESISDITIAAQRSAEQQLTINTTVTGITEFARQIQTDYSQLVKTITGFAANQ